MSLKGSFGRHEGSPVMEPMLQRERQENAVARKKVIVISGPTAVGKTRLSLQIAKIIGGEIISADSMQVYKGMDIGTAKVSQEERKIVPHHLIDTHDITDRFNVVDFYHEAMAALHDVCLNNSAPMIVGGTGFYIHSLIYGPPPGPASDAQLRICLEEELDRAGTEALYRRLLFLDPEYAATISKGDRQKILRGLEIIALTKQKVSALKAKKDQDEDMYDFRCWFLYMPKDILYQRIEERCHAMIDAGLIEEVYKLKEKGLEQNQSASQAIGYRQALDYLYSRQTPEDWERFVRQFKQASRRYVKRQFTWFRKEPLFRWIDLCEVDPEAVLEMIIQDYEIG